MRLLLIALMVAGSTLTAQGETDPLASYNAENSAESEILMSLQDVQSRLEALGYKDIQPVRDALVIRARDEANLPVVMLVDPETLQNLAIDREPSTTGSGSADDFRRDLK